MSGAFPTTPGPSRLSITSVTPTLISTAHSLARQVRSRGVQRWSMELEWEFETRSDFAPILAFAIAQRGQFETFTYIPAGHESALGEAGGTPLVNDPSATIAAGDRSVPIDGCTLSQTGWLKAGDFLKFGGHAKVYMLTADADTNGSGEVTLTIEPGLISVPANNEALTVASVPFTMAFTSDLVETAVEPPVLYGYGASMVESPL